MCQSSVLLIQRLYATMKDDSNAITVKSEFILFIILFKFTFYKWFKNQSHLVLLSKIFSTSLLRFLVYHNI